MNLKKIIENMDRMPSSLKGFTETPKLTTEQKRKLMDMVSKYNEIGQKLKIENSFIETANSLNEISELAETYACNEANDWFATDVVKKDFKRGKGIAQEYQKLARECYGKVQQLNALYEDMGHILGRYYEIADPMTEVNPNPTDIKSQRGLTNAIGAVDEVKPNTSNLKSQKSLPSGGPAPKQVKEVTTNDKNIKSQRDLPAGGPAPKQVKEVSVNTSNLKSQREVPHTNGPSTPQVKEGMGVSYNDFKTAIQSFQKLPDSLQDMIMNAVKNQFGSWDLEGGLLKFFKQTGGDFTRAFRQENPVALESNIVDEVAPAGWEGTVKAMKKEPGIDNPWALAHWMKGQGMTSHKEESVNEASGDLNSPKNALTSMNPKPQVLPDSRNPHVYFWVRYHYPHLGKKGSEMLKSIATVAGVSPEGGGTDWMYRWNNAQEEVVNEVNPNTSNLQSQRELPQGGPESCNCPDPTNPSVPVNPAGAGEMNVKGTREDPQGGPAPKQVKESNTEDSPKSETGTHGWEKGKAWKYDHKTGKRVWDTGTKEVDEVAPNTSNLQSQRRLPSLGDILRMK